MPRKSPPFPAYLTWTTSRFWSFIRSALRSAYNKYPPKYELLQENRVKVEGRRHKWEYECAGCKQRFLQKEVAVDHIQPVGQLKDYKDLPEFVRRLFCKKEELQVLCHSCHLAKTKYEKDLAKNKTES